MKVIVTGGAGFLGSHLCDRLIEDGQQVICIDNLITGSLNNISQIRSHPRFSFLKSDVTQKLPPNLTAEQIYHLASPASPNKNNPKSYLALPFETMLVNTTGTWNLSEMAVRLKAKLLFASTSEIYGDPLEHPQREEYRGNASTTGPRSVYDESKRFGETITAAFVRHKGLNGRTVRIFNTYGPRMADDGRVISEFLKAALSNQPIGVFGAGTQTRSFCYVTDLIEGLILAMNRNNTSGEILNLGNPEEYNIIKLAEKIKKMTKSASKINFTQALPKDDPIKRRPDITKTQAILGWNPKVNFDEGLSMLLTFLKKA